MKDADGSTHEPVRLDKWLWAARFFKTRGLAKLAIESGKVRYNGQRSKVGRAVEIGARLTVPQGWDDLELDVLAVSAVRGPAVAARQLYSETEASRVRRERSAAERRALAGSAPQTPKRPNKKQRRQLDQLKRELFE